MGRRKSSERKGGLRKKGKDGGEERGNRERTRGGVRGRRKI